MSPSRVGLGCCCVRVEVLVIVETVRVVLVTVVRMPATVAIVGET